jgi:hypothetical protein
MMPFDSSLVAVSAWVTAGFGLAGSLIGGADRGHGQSSGSPSGPGSG